MQPSLQPRPATQREAWDDADALTVRQYARIQSDRVAAAAFAAALSRFLNSPRGAPFASQGPVDVRAGHAPDGQHIDVFLDDIAIMAAEEAFSPLPETDVIMAADLPGALTSLLPTDGQALGLEDVLPLLPSSADPAVSRRTSLRDRLRGSLTEAMRARDRRAVAVLRTTLAAIDNAEALPLSAAGDGPVVGRSADVARRELDEQRILAVVRAELRERVEAAALYERLDRPDEVAALHAEMRLLLAHLPEE